MKGFMRVKPQAGGAGSRPGVNGRFAATLVVLFVLFFPFASIAEEPAEPDREPFYGYRVVNAYPHDPEAFTQGLAYEDGLLFESTGLEGRSTIRRVAVRTGQVLQALDLPADCFGEGLTLWRDSLVQLTWKSGIAFVYTKDSFIRSKQFAYQTEGWGITQDGAALIMSDGGSELRFLAPETFAEIRRIEVRRRNGASVRLLNELEYIKGEIFANIWHSDLIVRISPKTGEVLGWIDLGGLRDSLPASPQRIDVLNGIAYDAAHDHIFVTGKLWPRLFEIELDSTVSSNVPRSPIQTQAHGPSPLMN